MAVDFTEPPIGTPFFDDAEQGSMNPAWEEWFGVVSGEINDAVGEIDTKLNASTFKQVVSGDDSSNVTTPIAIAGVDTVDMADLNTKLATLATEINSIVTVVNNIWDKLEEGGFTRSRL